MKCGPYLFIANDGRQFYAIVFFNGWQNMVRFITPGGLDLGSSIWNWEPVATSDAAARFGRFIALVPRGERDADVGLSGRSDWLSRLPEPRRGTVREDCGCDGLAGDSARKCNKLDPFLRYLMELGGGERSKQRGDKRSGFAAAPAAGELAAARANGAAREPRPAAPNRHRLVRQSGSANGG